MSQVDNEQLNNIVQDAVNATANAHQKYIAALEQRLKDKDAEIAELRKENERLYSECEFLREESIISSKDKETMRCVIDDLSHQVKTAKAETVKKFAKMLRANKIKGEFAQRDDYYVNVINIDQLEEIAGDAL